ncbi:MAG: TIGR04149 family rSAM-modified RiPP [Candidatus Sulfotelmatobacter sp.]
MKKLNKLTLKKITLRDLDTRTLDAVAGGSAGATWNANCTSSPCTTGYTRGFCERLGPDNQRD